MAVRGCDLERQSLGMRFERWGGGTCRTLQPSIITLTFSLGPVGNSCKFSTICFLGD